MDICKGLTHGCQYKYMQWSVSALNGGRLYHWSWIHACSAAKSYTVWRSATTSPIWWSNRCTSSHVIAGLVNIHHWSEHFCPLLQPCIWVHQHSSVSLHSCSPQGSQYSGYKSQNQVRRNLCTGSLCSRSPALPPFRTQILLINLPLMLLACLQKNCKDPLQV